MKPDRHEALRHHLYERGASSIDALAAVTGASVATVRRDLVLLEKQGVVSRTHGGARIASDAHVELAFEIRERHRLSEKRAIAGAAYDLLRPETAVFLDAGTTVLQLARRLRMSPIPLTVFTNGLPVAQALMGVPRLHVTLLGGRLRSENASLVGPAAEAMLDGLWFDRLFMGATAIGDDCVLYSLDPAEASLNTRMMARSASTTILADSTKFGRRTTYRVAALDAATALISDRQLDAAHRRRLADSGVALSIATPKRSDAASRDDAS